MFFSDFNYIFSWWLVLFLIGVVFLPFTSKIFSSFFDRGYAFSKVIGIFLISYSVFLLGSLKILPFSQISIIFILVTFLLINVFIFVKVPPSLRWHLGKTAWKIFSTRGGPAFGWLLEEILFFLTLLFWSYIRSHEPSIHGLEKYMDFGFVNSILRADYFPPKDMWYSPLPINYYYFGHLVTAVLTKLSGISSAVTYNLMLATLFALTFTGAFSVGANLIELFKRGVTRLEGLPTARSSLSSGSLERALAGGKVVAGPRVIFAGLLTAIIVAFAGNLHTLYAFFQPYIPADSPLPFWQLPFDFNFSGYWYPNATRFIPFTIHEFPIYSFIVSDLHGHVLDIPFVLLAIALLLSILISKSLNILNFLFLSVLIAVMYMTNAWDGLIYASLTLLVFIYLAYHSKNYTLYAIRYTLIIVSSILLTLPFSLNFKPFIAGIGLICAPEFLTNLGKLGPFLFETDHCQRSPIWQLLILYGFFYFFVLSFIVALLLKLKTLRSRLHTSDIFVLLLIFLATLLIIIPEFLYVKDIYPAHYRANTMFKLGYQAFIMLGIASAYIAVRFILNIKNKIFNFYYVYLLFAILSLILVMIYPYFAINSYYGNLKTYRGLDGFSYLKNLYPSDYEAIFWLCKNIKGQPVILEAQGDSYTDFARVSSNTGLPTIIGWPVHEWLWRGSYEVATPRIVDVQTLYETEDLSLTQELLKKYNISLIFIGDLERQKYQKLFEDKFGKLGRVIFENGQTRIYSIGQLSDSI